jgi:hypothetical protein
MWFFLVLIFFFYRFAINPKQTFIKKETMPIPKPTANQTENEYVSECIAFLIGEGKDKEQAAAICYDNWKNKDKLESQAKTITITKK